eukprot:TRINITY_DN8999_c0_g1_i1.p1 TRINITY_DN8999_c0_g1~~TRINITY_DN8999_c0_g1_i1.p1  ORF type:complete len:904 (+),score=354.75 TRINITY_DN8999_c0_g1_i1:125-2836(+)
MGNAVGAPLQASGPALAAIFDPERGSIIVVCRHGFEYFLASSQNASRPQVLKSMVKAHKNTYIACATYIAEDDLFLTGDEDGKIRTYQASTGKFLRTFGEFIREATDTPEEESRDSRDHQRLVSTVSWSGQPVRSILHIAGSRVVAGGADGVVRVYKIKNGEEIAAFVPMPPAAGKSAAVVSLAFDAARNAVFAGFADGVIRVLSIDQGTLFAELKGHFGSILALVAVKFSDLLVSSSADGTVRVWDLDTGRELSGYKFFAQCLYYDQVRDVLFCGSNDGSFAIAKLIQNQTGDGSKTAEIRILRKSQVHKLSLFSLWYDTRSDTLVTADTEGKVGYWPGITAMPYDEASKSTAHILLDDKGELDDKAVNELIGEFGRTESPDASSLSLISSERKLMDLCVQLLEGGSEDSQARKDSIRQGFDQIMSDLQAALDQAYSVLAAQKDALKTKHVDALQPELGRKTVEDSIDRRREELLQRHQRELQEFESKAQSERRAYDESIPAAKRRAAAKLLALKMHFYRQQNQMEANVSASLRNFLSESFPIINNIYQIGNPVSRTSGSVFKGLNLSTFDLVAIKAFPSMVSLDTSLKHDTLVPVIDVCATEGTIFVIMSYMKENLAEYVARQPNQTVEPSRIAQIIYTLLKSLVYLHANRMVVRDLRPQHVLLNNDEQPRLTHLGIMRSLLGTTESEFPEEGRIYAAPELFGRVVKGSSDIWSLGCIFLYLLQSAADRALHLFNESDNRAILTSMVQLTGKPAKADLDKMGADCKMADDGLELLHYVWTLPDDQSRVRTPLRQLVPKASPLALNLLSQMLQFPTHSRISAVEALQHPYFAEYGLAPSYSEKNAHPHTDLTTNTTTLSDDATSEPEDHDVLNNEEPSFGDVRPAEHSPVPEPQTPPDVFSD